MTLLSEKPFPKSELDHMLLVEFGNTKYIYIWAMKGSRFVWVRSDDEGNAIEMDEDTFDADATHWVKLKIVEGYVY